MFPPAWPAVGQPTAGGIEVSAARDLDYLKLVVYSDSDLDQVTDNQRLLVI
jgi:hypothetical protein